MEIEKYEDRLPQDAILSLKEGDMIEAAEVEKILGLDPGEDPGFKLLCLTHYIRKLRMQNELPGVITTKHKSILVLKPEDGSRYCDRRQEQCLSTFARLHEDRIALVDRASLDTDQQRSYDRSVAVSGKLLAAIKSTAKANKPAEIE
jgi:hypothetical protein